MIDAESTNPHQSRSPQFDRRTHRDGVPKVSVNPPSHDVLDIYGNRDYRPVSQRPPPRNNHQTTK